MDTHKPKTAAIANPHSTTHSPACGVQFSLTERFCLKAGQWFNHRVLLKKWGQVFLRTFVANWIHLCIRHILHVEGMEHLKNLPPGARVLIVSNHRTFFDMYIIACVLLKSKVKFIERMFFPVRANFFYESFLGVFLNGLMAAMSMYPPIYRQKERKHLNESSLQTLIELFKQPGTLVGFHPEGKRNTGHDPYTLLPPKSGVGQLAYHARPIIVPIFTAGIAKNAWTQIKNNWKKTGPVNVIIGAPLDLSDYYNQSFSDSEERYQAIAQHLNHAIHELGQHEKKMHTSAKQI